MMKYNHWVSIISILLVMFSGRELNAQQKDLTYGKTPGEFSPYNNFQKAYQIDKKNPTILLNLAVISDAVFNQKGRAMTYYNQYLEAVKLLPKEKTQSEKVRRRLTELQNL